MNFFLKIIRLGYKSQNLNFHVSEFQKFHVSEFQSFRVSEFQSFRVSGFNFVYLGYASVQGFRVSKLPVP